MTENDNTEPVVSVKRTLRVRPKLRRALPTDRVTFSRQLDILRAAVAASGPERKPVSNDDIAKIVSIHYGSISNCNPFFLESGLFTRNKLQNIPCDDVFSYAERHEWDAVKAAHKLAPTLRKAWFCTTLIPKLNFRALPIEEAIGFLAEESGATKDNKDQLAMVIEYMKAAGIVAVDNGMVSLIKNGSGESSQKDYDTEEEQQDEAPPPKTKKTVEVASENEQHPFITGLLKTLPVPETEWTVAGRVKWLQAASNIFGLIYTTKGQDTDEITIGIKKQSNKQGNNDDEL